MTRRCVVTDDIVTRLREEHANFRVVVGVNQNIVLNSLYTEAADEIERLRAELKRWQTCEMVTESICGWDSEKTYCDACKAVRGE